MHRDPEDGMLCIDYRIYRYNNNNINKIKIKIKIKNW
jgi:hypothetical protein